VFYGADNYNSFRGMKLMFILKKYDAQSSGIFFSVSVPYTQREAEKNAGFVEFVLPILRGGRLI
jgi:hypothetical protein